jgi:hypothetical protein
MPLSELTLTLSKSRIGSENFWPVWLIIVMGALEFAWAYWNGYQFILPTIVFAGIGLLATISIAYGISGRSKPISDMAYFGALWIGLTVVGVIFTYIMATLRLPLYDAYYAELDSMLGFHWPEWNNYVREHYFINVTLLFAYMAGLLQICVSIFYFAYTGNVERNKELWWTAKISLLLSSMLSGIFPALGAYHFYKNSLTNAVHLPDLLVLRDGSVTTFMVQEMQGIITLPSYHTVLAIIFIYAFRGLGVWFYTMCLLNILMLISTPSHGGHYLVDMIAGAAVAGVTIYFVRYFKRVT